LKRSDVVPFQVANGAGFVRAHERAVAGDVGGKDRGKTTLLALGHSGNPALRRPSK